MGWVSAAPKRGSSRARRAGRGRTRRGCGGCSISSHFCHGKVRSVLSRTQSGLPGAQVCCGRQLWERPPSPQPAGQTPGQTEGGEAALGNQPAARASPGREKSGAALTEARRAELPGAVPLSQVATAWTRVPSGRCFYGRFRADVTGEPGGDRAGASPLPAVPSHQISTGMDFHDSEGTSVYLTLADGGSLGMCSSPSSARGYFGQGEVFCSFPHPGAELGVCCCLECCRDLHWYQHPFPSTLHEK